ncbi:hypothetical protein [uncultured Draconibacterium sp.]|uniref:hypothetical protein n=1 Tax=uncultured Draconibacterium sp. TaxID=1573823 RepID=UPI0025EF1AD5|nr:hypothetical protein [uncultured Draconibacterium sp.]
MNKKENITNPTPEDIKKWEGLYGKVNKLEIDTKFKTADGEEFDNEEDARDHAEDLVADKRGITTESVVAYLRNPSRKIISMATSVGGKDPIKFGELILQNCWLGGDERIKTDDDLFLAANAVLGDLIKIRSARIKNC